MELFQFLNLQYWYCVVYSLFGGRCAFLEEARKQREITQGPLLERLVDTFERYVNSAVSVRDSVSDFFLFLWNAYSAFAWGVSGVLFLAILATLAILVFLRIREWNAYGTLPPKTEEEKAAREKWNELLEDALSNDPKLWKEGIIAADRMLGELLAGLAISGATTADRMRALPENAFQTVPQAWEAHRVRNFVSSGASDYILTQREAYRVMKLYEQVFEEHGYI